jgi:hypothetical protein
LRQCSGQGHFHSGCHRPHQHAGRGGRGRCGAFTLFLCRCPAVCSGSAAALCSGPALRPGADLLLLSGPALRFGSALRFDSALASGLLWSDSRSGTDTGTRMCGGRTSKPAAVERGCGCPGEGAATPTPPSPHTPAAAVNPATTAHARRRFPQKDLTRSWSAPRPPPHVRTSHIPHMG